MKIRVLTPFESWKHLFGVLNPADLPSRKWSARHLIYWTRNGVEGGNGLMSFLSTDHGKIRAGVVLEISERRNLYYCRVCILLRCLASN